MAARNVPAGTPGSRSVAAVGFQQNDQARPRPGASWQRRVARCAGPVGRSPAPRHPPWGPEGDPV